MDALNRDDRAPAEAAADQRPVGYLEVLNRGGRVVERLPVRHRRIHIGRAYDNDLIIDDPYVCPHHLSVQWDGERLRVIDRGSLNGFETDRPAAAGDGQHTLACGEQLRLGKTTVRFRSAAFPVPPTRVEGAGLARVELFGHPLVQAAIMLLLVGSMLLGKYLGTTRSFEPLKAAPEIVAVLFAVMFWALLWSFASRIMLHRWNFWIHCSIAATGILLQELGEELLGYVTFAFGLDRLTTLFVSSLDFVLIAAALFLHLLFASQAAPMRLLKGAGCVSAALIGLLLVVRLAQQSDFDNDPSYQATLKPPVFRLAGGQSPEAFFAVTAELVETVDAEVAEADKADK